MAASVLYGPIPSQAERTVPFCNACAAASSGRRRLGGPAIPANPGDILTHHAFEVRCRPVRCGNVRRANMPMSQPCRRGNGQVRSNEVHREAGSEVTPKRLRFRMNAGLERQPGRGNRGEAGGAVRAIAVARYFRDFRASWAWCMGIGFMKAQPLAALCRAPDPILQSAPPKSDRVCAGAVMLPHLSKGKACLMAGLRRRAP